MVELTPAVAPVLRYVDGLRAGKCATDLLLPRLVRVDGELNAVRTLDFLEAPREEREQPGARFLGLLERGEDRDAFQRNALLSLSKKP